MLFHVFVNYSLLTIHYSFFCHSSERLPERLLRASAPVSREPCRVSAPGAVPGLPRPITRAVSTWAVWSSGRPAWARSAAPTVRMASPCAASSICGCFFLRGLFGRNPRTFSASVRTVSATLPPHTIKGLGAAFFLRIQPKTTQHADENFQDARKRPCSRGVRHR